MRILSDMGMVSVMMSTTMKPASLMEEIAVDLMFSAISSVQYVNALKEEEGAVEELQLAEIAIRVGLLMGIVMI